MIVELAKVKATIEAVLFTLGEAVELDRIAKTIGHDEETTKRVLQSLMEDYAAEERGIQIIEIDGSYQMCTKETMYDALIRITHIPKKHVLTDVQLETLSIIAYKQPITRVEIEAIRGVKCDHAINKLIEYNLVCEAGRLDVPGKPILFGTTDEFLRSFGITSLEDLPVLDSDKLEDFKSEAEEEVQLQLSL